jgi:hypothetical protein
VVCFLLYLPYPDVADDNLLKLYQKDWDGASDCELRAQALPFLDPVAALDRDIYSLFNSFAYMGIYDDQGMPKAGVTQTWLDALP